MKVLVAGAGLAGLHAAWLLRRSGHEVTVCEARDRVGGRVWSERLPNGVCVERGGEFIFPSERVVLGLCARLGLPIIPHGLSFFRRNDPEGRAPTVEHLTGVLERLGRVMERTAGEPVSVAEAFEAALGPAYEEDPVFLRTATSTAADPGAVSAAAELGPEVAGRSSYIDHTYHVAGGNQQLATSLAADLDVRPECPVGAVDQTAGSVELTLRDGSRLVADAAVVAVPFPLLLELDRGFSWPPAIERALGTLVMGTAVKASVPLVAGATPRGVQAQQRWWAWNSLAASNEQSAAAVTAFASTAPDVVRAQRDPWPARVQRLRPDLEVTGEAVVTDWEQEVWTGGAYTVPGVAWRPGDELAFNAPVGRVVLAGEHTSATYGTMEGALRTGKRAAKLVVACFG